MNPSYEKGRVTDLVDFADGFVHTFAKLERCNLIDSDIVIFILFGDEVSLVKDSKGALIFITCPSTILVYDEQHI